MVILPPTGEPAEYNSNYILFWNNVGLDLNRLSVSIGGVLTDPPGTSRGLAMLHLAIHDAYFAIHPDPKGSFTTYLTPNDPNPDLRLPDLGGANDARQATAGAANTVLLALYTTPSATIGFQVTNQLSQFLQDAVNSFPLLNTLSSSYRFGVAVGNAILNLLNIKPGEPGFSQDSYRPTPGKYKFNDDPSHPVRIVPVNPNDPDGPKKAIKVYDAPFYGLTAKRLAVQYVIDGQPSEHILADPPVGFGRNDKALYDLAVEEVYREGGSANILSTRRKVNETVTGFFWAYDGAILLGSPPRHYNQILRQLAWDRKPGPATSEETNADFARLFALTNAAQGDAGVFAWLNKYCFEFWRPLSGVRQDAGNPLQDPFWLTLGAPDTNNNEGAFKPPFPAYPSGHATFGGAFFQMTRLYYHARDKLTFEPNAPDDIAFTARSDELNGISRDLYQPFDPNQPITAQQGLVRTDLTLAFPSLWAAMFSNAISRVYLGVHWGFDAFDANDVLESKNLQPDGEYAYKDPKDIRYEAMSTRGDRPGGKFPIGGVPLGIGIANDIWQSGLKPTPVDRQPTGRNKCGDRRVVNAQASPKTQAQGSTEMQAQE